jgi:hypothetical protein
MSTSCPVDLHRESPNKCASVAAVAHEGEIGSLRSVINPDKLGHVGAVTETWAVLREANQTRRPTA